MSTTAKLTSSTVAITVLFASAALQGLSVVALPASATILYDRLDLSAMQYGGLFIPQTIGALAGALVSAPLSRARGLWFVLGLAGILHVAAQLILVTATPAHAVALGQLSAGALGLGFGLGAAPLNTLPSRLFPRRAEAGVVAVHTAVGAGFALGPAIVGLLAQAGRWAVYPFALAGIGAVLALAALRVCLPVAPATTDRGRRPAPRSTVVLLVGVAVAYAFAEGTFGNWATTFLHEDRGVTPANAGLALSAFWAALAGGRLLVAAIVTRVRATVVWSVLPVGMAVVMALLPSIHGTAGGIAGYAAAGLAASAFFPLTVAIATERSGLAPETISALLTAALMIGVGIASSAIGALRALVGFDLLFRLGALVPLLALALGLFAFRRQTAS